MNWPVEEDYFLKSYSERCEQELVDAMAETDGEIIKFERLRKSAAWVTAQRIAKDFEDTFHLVKSVDAKGNPLMHNGIHGESTITLSRPSLMIPVSYPSGVNFEICLDFKHDKDVTYFDIHPASTPDTDDEGQEYIYYGAHLFGLVQVDGGIALQNGLELPEDSYTFYLPFRNLKVAENHRTGIYN